MGVIRNFSRLNTLGYVTFTGFKSIGIPKLMKYSTTRLRIIKRKRCLLPICAPIVIGSKLEFRILKWNGLWVLCRYDVVSLVLYCTASMTFVLILWYFFVICSCDSYATDEFGSKFQLDRNSFVTSRCYAMFNCLMAFKRRFLDLSKENSFPT